MVQAIHTAYINTQYHHPHVTLFPATLPALKIDPMQFQTVIGKMMNDSKWPSTQNVQQISGKKTLTVNLYDIQSLFVC